MNQKTKILQKALLAALESCLLLLPAGVLFFFPFAETYELLNIYQTFGFSGLCMLVFSLSISFFILVPSTVVIEQVKEKVSREELAGALSTISLVLVLGATLAYKGFTKPGDNGKILLFSLLMTIIFVSYIFTVRYKHRTQHFSGSET